MEKLGEVPVAVIEKAKTCGGHNLSGAVMRPGPLQELFPELTREDWRKERFAFGEVTKESVYMLPNGQDEAPGPDHRRAELQEPRQRGRLGGGAGPLPAAPGRGGRRVRPDRDLGHAADRRGRQPSSACARATRAAARTASRCGNFEPGTDIKARVTVLAEGCWGHLTGAAIKEFDLGRGPRAAGVGARGQGGVEGAQAA